MSVVLEDIKYFLFVSETLNITRASELAGITQPALSYSVKRLERELGGPLLIRLKNGVQLTKLGESFAQRGRALLFEWGEIKALVSNEKGAVVGKYSLGVHPSVALYTLEHFLPELDRSFPNLEFNLEHGLSREITKKVINWELDFGIIVNPKKHPDLIIKELCQDRVALFSHSKKKSSRLIYDSELIQSNSILKKLQKSQHKFKHQLTSGNLEVIAKLTSIGYGTGILPERVAKQYKNLSIVDEQIFFKDKICFVFRVEKHKDLAGKTIISHILNTSF